jgi:hypothetical protein
MKSIASAPTLQGAPGPIVASTVIDALERYDKLDIPPDSEGINKKTASDWLLRRTGEVMNCDRCGDRSYEDRDRVFTRFEHSVGKKIIDLGKKVSEVPNERISKKMLSLLKDVSDGTKKTNGILEIFI